MESTTPNQVHPHSVFILFIEFMQWLTLGFFLWPRLLESHILPFAPHSLPQSEILPSKSALSLLSLVSSIPSDQCTGWFQRCYCFVSPAKTPLPHAEKPNHMLATPWRKLWRTQLRIRCTIIQPSYFFIEFMQWLTFHFLSWHRLRESHIFLFVQHSLPQSKIQPSKLV